MAEEPRDVSPEAFADRLFQAFLGSLDLFSIYLGQKLGLYQAFRTTGPMTSRQLADATSVHERYAREWAEQQAVTGILTVQHAEGAAADRVYALPPGPAEVLLDGTSLNYGAGMALWTATGGARLQELLSAYRTGEGVPWSAYGADAIEAQEASNRPLFLNLMTTEWLPVLPDVHRRLQGDRPALVADVACGAGWLSIAMALGYPKVRVDGFDLDEASIARARHNAEDAGVSDRVTFHVRDAGDPDLAGRYDLVIMFEALHDLGRPVDALRAMGGLAGDDGVVLVADERVAETFSPSWDPVERVMYGYSILFCLPNGLADEPSAGTGTVMRPDTVRRYAAEAGFNDVEILPIEHDFLRLYRLHR